MIAGGYIIQDQRSGKFWRLLFRDRGKDLLTLEHSPHLATEFDNLPSVRATLAHFVPDDEHARVLHYPSLAVAVMPNRNEPAPLKRRKH